MTSLFVRHQVADFAQWKAAYDAFRPTQQALGVTAEAVYRSPEDPNDVTVTHDFATLDAARAFVESQDLRSAMEQAGVAGEPTIWFTEKV
jgi:hypothetical protein